MAVERVPKPSRTIMRLRGGWWGVVQVYNECVLIVEQLILSHVIVGHGFSELIDLVQQILSDL